MGEVNIKNMQFSVLLNYITFLVDYQASVCIIRSNEFSYYIFSIDLYHSVLKILLEKAIYGCQVQVVYIFS